MTTHHERMVFSAIIRLAFLTVSVATVLALFSPLNWFAELFSHFRFYYLLIQALLILIFLHRERWALLAVTLMLAVPNAWYVGPYLTPLAMPTSVAAHTTESLRGIALNLNYRNTNDRAVREYLLTAAPDIIVASELTDQWDRALRFLDTDYPYQVGQTQRKPWGLRIYSRYPFLDTQLLDLGVPGTVHARVIVDAGGEPLQVFGVHLYSPTDGERAAKRNTQLRHLAAQTAGTNIPTVVLGDFNLTPFSPYFSRFLDAADLEDARRASGFHFTWPTVALPLWIPIDHALANALVPITRVERGPDIGSDHYPLEVSIACCRGDVRVHSNELRPSSPETGPQRTH